MDIPSAFASFFLQTLVGDFTAKDTIYTISTLSFYNKADNRKNVRRKSLRQNALAVKKLRQNIFSRKKRRDTRALFHPYPSIRVEPFKYFLQHNVRHSVFVSS